jgi:hypothetical protein
VPPKLAARMQLLQAGATNKNDLNDARSVAVAALRSAARRREVTAEDHAAVQGYVDKHEWRAIEAIVPQDEAAKECDLNSYSNPRIVSKGSGST